MNSTSRRGFLAGCAAACLLGRAAHGAAAPAGAIDVHHHLLPPRYLGPAREYLARTSPGLLPVYDAKWSPALAIEEMDRHGIATSIASISAPGVWFHDAAQARAMARECNDYAAALKRDHQGRFGAFAVLPMPDVDASLREIEYALDTLRLDGIGLFTSYGDRWLGNAALAPVFDELNRRKAVVYVHPTAANCCVNLQPELHAALLEFPFDTTRTIASLLYSGTLRRCPSIRFIFSHGGGALAMVNTRLGAPALQPEHAAHFPNGILPELRKLWYDTASVTNPPAFAALSKLVPTTQILFGTDYPLGPPMITGVKELAALGLDARELQMIRRDNAAALLSLS